MGRVTHTAESDVALKTFPSGRIYTAVPLNVSKYGSMVTDVNTRLNMAGFEEGVTVLAVNGGRCHGATDSRRLLRNELSKKRGNIRIKEWRPPRQFVIEGASPMSRTT